MSKNKQSELNVEAIKNAGLRFNVGNSGELNFAGNVAYYPKSGKWRNRLNEWFAGDVAVFVAWYSIPVKTVWTSPES